MAVSPATVATALGVAAPASGSTTESQWQMWIDDALLLIGARLGDVTLLDQASVDYVVREAVVAHARNPDDATQVTHSVDDASVSRTYRSSKGRIAILDEWWSILDPDFTGSESYSVQAYGEPDTATYDPWLGA